MVRCATHVYTHPCVPGPIPSKFLPLRRRLSCRMGTASRFINFSEGGGEPSTQPFQPFFAAERFLRGGADIVRRSSCAVTASPSSGVRGRFDEVCDVLDEMEGPGVEAGVEARRRGGDVGDGVTETERCTEGMRIVGRVRQKLLCEPLVVKRIEGGSLLVLGKLSSAIARSASTACSSLRARAAALSFLFSSRLCSFFSCFLFCLASSSRSTSLYGPTPFSRLVSTSLGGRGSKAPAMTVVALRRMRLGWLKDMVWWERRTAMYGTGNGFIRERESSWWFGSNWACCTLTAQRKHQQTQQSQHVQRPGTLGSMKINLCRIYLRMALHFCEAFVHFISSSPANARGFPSPSFYLLHSVPT